MAMLFARHAVREFRDSSSGERRSYDAGANVSRHLVVTLANRTIVTVVPRIEESVMVTVFDTLRALDVLLAPCTSKNSAQLSSRTE
jgi:hypothetical protein